MFEPKIEMKTKCILYTSKYLH